MVSDSCHPSDFKSSICLSSVGLCPISAGRFAHEKNFQVNTLRSPNGVTCYQSEEQGHNTLSCFRKADQSQHISLLQRCWELWRRSLLIMCSNQLQDMKTKTVLPVYTHVRALRIIQWDDSFWINKSCWRHVSSSKEPMPIKWQQCSTYPCWIIK